MNSTNVPSPNNSELTMMTIGVDKENLRGYKVTTGEIGSAEIATYVLQNQLEAGLPVGNAVLEKSGLKTANGKIIPMKNENAYEKVKNNAEKRKKLQLTNKVAIGARSNDNDIDR